MENDLEQRLGAILSNPAMMQQIQAMAASLGQQNQQDAPSQREAQEEKKTPQIDLSSLQALSGLAGNTGVDANQKALLSALSPYLSRDRVSKLENAMRAAKMARLASAFLGKGAINLPFGR